MVENTFLNGVFVMAVVFYMQSYMFTCFMFHSQVD